MTEKPQEERPSSTEKKKKEKFQKIQRLKTEKMVSKIAKDNPEMLGEASKEILSRIDHNALQRNNLAGQISPDIHKKKNDELIRSIEKSTHK